MLNNRTDEFFSFWLVERDKTLSLSLCVLLPRSLGRRLQAQNLYLINYLNSLLQCFYFTLTSGGGVTSTQVSEVKRLIDVPPLNIWSRRLEICWAYFQRRMNMWNQFFWRLISWLDSQPWATSNKQTANHRRATMMWLANETPVNQGQKLISRRRFYLFFRRKTFWFELDGCESLCNCSFA